ncbi:winged helix-turn-helix domain-containing protein [Telluria beijingensis]|uniref:winged helix-turn-helix domain-containing protein n=1 Tax=Telluria beijingensis TaxID=3068633 RepID=UPI002795A0BE|nr:winged helix-turn-helix domain-containing protein [Massilia sp. REN29]
MESGPPALTRIAFLDFELRPAQRLLLRAGLPLPVGARAFDLLVLLVSHPGEVLSNRALMAAAWPRTVVIDANLRVQIAALRKLLGDAGSAIVNVSGRGYAFTAVVGARPAPADAPDQEPGAAATAPRSASIVAGLVRCTSKPAASARATSACWP